MDNIKRSLTVLLVVFLIGLAVDVAFFTLAIGIVCWAFSVPFTFKYVIGTLVIGRVLGTILRSK